MIRIKTIIIVIACGLPSHLFCQNISGKITGADGRALPVANVVIRDTGNAGAIREFVLARDGLYSIKLTRSYSSVMIEATANGYQKGSFPIEKLEAGKHYEWDFILNKISPVDLKEVVVKAKQRPFAITKDTVTYNVAAYRDGTERKVQDVLKNMPGIDVNSKTGEIKYKGKPVETVKLDGEDLFADNYAIGTKNINVDMVEQVQAIENYTANPLLKGIEGGEKVALNLVLKKRKTAYNGDAEIGTGMLGKKLALDLSANLIGIAKTMKSYATASFNNVGSNNSIFDYFSYNPGVQQIREEEFLAKKYIPDLYFDSDVDSRRMNLNRERSASYHAVFKVFKKINVKTANYFVGDHIRAFQSDRTINRFNNQSFSTADFYSYSKQPWQLRSDLELKSSLTKKSLLEYVLQVRKESVTTANDAVQNDTGFYNTRLVSNDRYVRQQLTYTNRLRVSKALQLTFRHSADYAPQEFHFLPPVYKPDLYISNVQKAAFRKRTYSFQGSLLGNTSKSKYALSTGATWRTLRFHSGLAAEGPSGLQYPKDFLNKLTYDQRTFFANGQYRFKLGRFKFTPQTSLSYLSQTRNDQATDSSSRQDDILLEPSLGAAYTISSTAALLLNGGYRQKSANEEELISQPVYLSTRLVRSNEPVLAILKSKTVSLSYIVANLYKQFQLTVLTGFLHTRGAFLPDLKLGPSSTTIQYRYVDVPTKNIIANANVEKYLPGLEGTIKVKTAYSGQLYRNILNGSMLRENRLANKSAGLFFKTAFDGKINFQNSVDYTQVSVQSGGKKVFSIESLTNNFQVIVKPTKSMFLLLNTDYYVPDLSKRSGLLFIDIEARLRPKAKLYSMSLRAHNLLNHTQLSRIETTDYSKSFSATGLLPRSIVFRISRSF